MSELLADELERVHAAACVLSLAVNDAYAAGATLEQLANLLSELLMENQRVGFSRERVRAMLVLRGAR